MTDITERLRDIPRANLNIGELVHDAADEIERLRARVAELEAADGICFTAMLVEIDGHAYGLRPNAARIVREALRDAGRYRWLRDDGDGPANAIAAAVAEGDNEHGGEYVSWLYGDELDAAIDSEIQALHGHHFGCPAKDGA